MIGAMVRWWREKRAWEREHVLAWAGQTDPDQSGLTPFQQLLEPELANALRSLGREPEEREVLPCDGIAMVHGYFASKHWEYWIYPDSAEAMSVCGRQVRYEEWDAKTPAELIGRFTDKLSDELKAHRC